MTKYSTITTFLVLLAALTARYFVLSGGFYLWHNKGRDIGRDVLWSLQSTVVFSLFGTLLFHLWHQGHLQVYFDAGSFPLWYLPLSFLFYLFLQDTYFYWTHRLMHRFCYRTVHAAHHESRNPTAFTSFAFHPIEAMIQAAFLPVILLFVPIHVTGLITFLFFMSLFGVTNHLGKEIYSAKYYEPLRLITASHHQLHHLHPGKNFGLFFTFWDRWMKTAHS